MEELLSDIEPPRDQIFDDLAQDLRDGLIVPLLIGAAERGNGVTRLLKALRHEAPGIERTRERLGLAASGAPLAHIMRTIHTAHGGKLSIGRVIRGSFTDGDSVSNGAAEQRIAGVSRLMGSSSSKQEKISEGDTAAFGRLESFATGNSFVAGRPDTKTRLPALMASPPLPPVHAFAIGVKDRKEETRLAAALAKLIDEDPSLTFTQDQASGEMKLAG